VSGSAPIPPDLIRWYRKIGLELLEGYGMSENFAYSHFSRPGRGRIGYVGEPNPGVEHRISEEGEIQVRSPADMLGYYKMPEETKASFTEDGFLKTGDRGEIDEQNRLKITGRVKELFKTSKGKYVAPAPIENLLNASALIEQSFVTGSGREAACACVMLSEELRARRDDPALADEIGPQLKELLFEVNGKVEPHERLAFLVVVRDEWLIENDFLTPTMKIKRSVLEDVYGPKLEEWYSSGQKVIWE
ncbi:MAG: AMP-binding acetyl-CoA synthetase, partial [Candidatus Dadabacteria bacterium]